MTAAAAFFTLTVSFAVFIWVTGLRQPKCIGGVYSVDGAGRGDFFSDAFMLSWTTFSTVGYGVVYSGISADGGINNISVCAAMTLLVSLEAFVGVLFGGMCGAVLFIKVSRVQSFAQVTFSDIICVRYGSGVMVENADDGEIDGSHSTSDDSDYFPSPVLEFRIINRLHSVPGGEIIDATVNVVANIDARQACQSLRDLTGGRQVLAKKRRGRNTARRRRRLQESSDEFFVPALPLPPEAMTSPNKGAGGAISSALDQDPTGYLHPRRIMTKLDCLTHDHPFFKRVFILRHTLDHHSPLLTTSARQRVKRSGGLWPSDMTNAEHVRRSIRFDHLLVNLSGTSNADAKSVYAQTVYELSDVHVGYSFVNNLYRDVTDGSLKVDTDLINDVMEQAGGGGESLRHRIHREVTEIPLL